MKNTKSKQSSDSNNFTNNITLKYNPSWDDITGSMRASVLLAQIAYLWNKNDCMPFTKFISPCTTDPTYNKKYSWTEDLNCSDSKIRRALKQIAFKRTAKNAEEEHNFPVEYELYNKKTYYIFIVENFDKWFCGSNDKIISKIRKNETGSSEIIPEKNCVYDGQGEGNLPKKINRTFIRKTIERTTTDKIKNDVVVFFKKINFPESQIKKSYKICESILKKKGEDCLTWLIEYTRSKNNILNFGAYLRTIDNQGVYEQHLEHQEEVKRNEKLILQEQKSLQQNAAIEMKKIEVQTEKHNEFKAKMKIVNELEQVNSGVYNSLYERISTNPEIRKQTKSCQRLNIKRKISELLPDCSKISDILKISLDQIKELSDPVLA